ncbi:MAG: cupin domain-containing protein [Nitrososphaeraceae archaeon]
MLPDKTIYKLRLAELLGVLWMTNKRSFKNGFALKEGKGTHISFRGTKMTVKVSSDDSEGKYSLIEMVHPPNIGPALHSHPDAPEAYYVLDGEYFIRFGEKTFTAKKNDLVLVPKGVIHNYQTGPEGGRMLVISPAGLEKYFEQVSNVLLNKGSITWDLEKEIACEYGQEFIDNLKHWGQ